MSQRLKCHTDGTEVWGVSFFAVCVVGWLVGCLFVCLICFLLAPADSGTCADEPDDEELSFIIRIHRPARELAR